MEKNNISERFYSYTKEIAEDEFRTRKERYVIELFDEQDVKKKFRRDFNEVKT